MAGNITWLRLDVFISGVGFNSIFSLDHLNSTLIQLSSWNPYRIFRIKLGAVSGKTTNNKLKVLLFICGQSDYYIPYLQLSKCDMFGYDKR